MSFIVVFLCTKLLTLSKAPREVLDSLDKISSKEGFLKVFNLTFWYFALKYNFKIIPKDRVDHDIRKYSLENIYTDLCKKYLENHDNENVWQLYALLNIHDGKVFDELKQRYKTRLNELKKEKKKSSSRDTLFNKTQAQIALRKIVDLFKANQVDLFMISGTFLGAVREKGFISTDYDIDLGFFEESCSFEKAINIIKTDKAFVLKKIDPDEYLFVVSYEGIVIDLFKHYQTDGWVWHSTQAHQWRNKPFELVEYELEGELYLGPKNYELYLEENYGNWRDPSLFYHFSFDTPNRVYHENAASLIFLQRIAEKGLKGKLGRFETQEALKHLKDKFKI